ncbi:adenosylcobinamide-phosphate synthase CbiB [Novosphingobium sp. KACC 22771]|uniref:adenosylcobinamide-phosphate synthase CbiB n=1 Tax=Novosphingobium sp. KACC 22771 TaxID=3025670 RepID=UPI002365613A|nr:adenosylcobinamide-phosphate synthase CbiB [Novosphingobium sp. KACC 22771]WDF74784.1 adenosylcobinamide-phosphate synthase CbiB [Novosphingobium sp. KACC 22771]
MVDPAVLVAVLIELVVGWPGWLYRRVGHPVGLFARIIKGAERIGNRGPAAVRRMGGVATVALLLIVAGGGGWMLQRVALVLPGSWLWVAAMTWPALAMRSLDDHARAVWRALRMCDLGAARRAVAMIVGRDTDDLQPDGVARAAIESLAESFCDGVLAPLFWLLVAGLPGVWAYKALNTADSLIGHPEPELRDFGWAAARADDLANWIPARLAGVAICLVGGGWRIMWRDCRRHASPNAGWSEAAMAGALGVRLAGPIRYDGVLREKAWIGQGPRARWADLGRALTLYRRACALVVLSVGALWLL